jgi:hypothetical protein
MDTDKFGLDIRPDCPNKIYYKISSSSIISISSSLKYISSSSNDIFSNNSIIEFSESGEIVLISYGVSKI